MSWRIPRRLHRWQASSHRTPCAWSGSVHLTERLSGCIGPLWEPASTGLPVLGLARFISPNDCQAALALCGSQLPQGSLCLVWLGSFRRTTVRLHWPFVGASFHRVPCAWSGSVHLTERLSGCVGPLWERACPRWRQVMHCLHRAPAFPGPEFNLADTATPGVPPRHSPVHLHAPGPGIPPPPGAGLGAAGSAMTA